MMTSKHFSWAMYQISATCRHIHISTQLHVRITRVCVCMCVRRHSAWLTSCHERSDYPPTPHPNPHPPHPLIKYPTVRSRLLRPLRSGGWVGGLAGGRVRGRTSDAIEGVKRNYYIGVYARDISKILKLIIIRIVMMIESIMIILNEANKNESKHTKKSHNIQKQQQQNTFSSHRRLFTNDNHARFPFCSWKLTTHNWRDDPGRRRTREDLVVLLTELMNDELTGYGRSGSDHDEGFATSHQSLSAVLHSSRVTWLSVAVSLHTFGV